MKATRQQNKLLDDLIHKKEPLAHPAEKPSQDPTCHHTQIIPTNIPRHSPIPKKTGFSKCNYWGGGVDLPRQQITSPVPAVHGTYRTWCMCTKLGSTCFRGTVGAPASAIFYLKGRLFTEEH